jgi:hypothetical protein
VSIADAQTRKLRAQHLRFTNASDQKSEACRKLVVPADGMRATSPNGDSAVPYRQLDGKTRSVARSPPSNMVST